MIAAIERKTLYADDAAFPARDMLFDVKFIARHLARQTGQRVESCTIRRVKYRFGQSLRIVFDISANGRLQIISARVFTGERGAAVFAEQNESLKNRSVFFDPVLNTVFWLFPNDRKIKNLDILKNVPRDLEVVEGRFWASCRLMAYAPEKCATAKCLDKNGEAFAYAKVFANGDGKRLYKVYKYLADKLGETDGYRIPSVFAYSEDYQTLIVKAVAGVCLADLERSRFENAFRLFGEAVGALHNIEGSTHLLPEFSRVKPERIAALAENIGKSHPEYAGRVVSLAAKLCSGYKFAGEPVVFLHGDVHPKNGILRSDGRLALIDFDQASFGNAAADIGSFLAGLEYKYCVGLLTKDEKNSFSNAFLSGYGNARALPDKASVRWHTAAALLVERAARATNRYRVEGLENFGAILELSEKCL